jgi:hypothetical protein
MNPVSRQDVQNIVEIARNRMMERMVTKQDLIAISDMTKTLLALHQQTQQLIRQGDYQRSQLSRRVVALEARTISLENEIRALSVLTSRLVDQQSPLVAAVTAKHFEEKSPGQAPQYVQQYRPA